MSMSDEQPNGDETPATAETAASEVVELSLIHI